MAITPNSVVHFLNVPLEYNYKNQIRFRNRDEQKAYMLSHKAKHVKTDEYLTFEEVTYLRKNSVIRVPYHIDDLLNANYVMYQNTSYTDRWFYAFITKMEYLNDDCTEVHILTDVWQTWFDRVTLKDSFIEREHVLKVTDVPGNYLLDEGLELGEYITNDLQESVGLLAPLQKYGLVIASTMSPHYKPKSGFYNGIYSGVTYYLFDNYVLKDNDYVFDVDYNIISEVETFIHHITSKGGMEAITGMFIVPSFLYENKTSTFPYTYKPTEDSIGVEHKVKYLVNSNGAYKSEEYFAGDKPTSLDGYIPRNKKLLCHPFTYLFVSNNNGGSAIYNYEDFEAPENYKDNCYFKLEGAISPGCSIRMFPCKYRGIEENYEQGLTLGKFPICSYANDMYTNWIVQNSGMMKLDIAQNIFNIATLGVGSSREVTTSQNGPISTTGQTTDSEPLIGIFNSAFSILRSMEQHNVASKQPYQARGNLNSGDVAFASGKNTFLFYHNSIREEYARRIDRFFDMYGYKVNTVKEIDIFARSKWNYIKTINVNVDGQIPQNDLNVIRAMFDSGITFWDKDVTIEDYSNPEENI